MDFINTDRQRFEAALSRLGASHANEGASLPGDLDRFSEACGYATAAGGKRVRPLLVYAAAEAVSAHPPGEAADYAACAVELIHCYSLTHDDLPAMDDDDLRRGKPSCHKAYDEATAILVGDALQARAFELLTAAPGIDDTTRLAMVSLLTRASGTVGMVGGQALDISATDQTLDLTQLQTLHSLKTGALISAAAQLGGLAGGAGDPEVEALGNYGRSIGLAFQVVDDILDVESDSATLGKTQGKDAADNKATYVRLLGLDEAKAEAMRLLDNAVATLRPLRGDTRKLEQLAEFIVRRES